ncbi:TPA: phage tail protein, partial [Acinetobacter baumannii]|nr:phage tail protein [Acinetobacter baumannii]HDI5576743.1 phage tail protein [Acinetobacter baumannii]
DAATVQALNVYKASNDAALSAVSQRVDINTADNEATALKVDAIDVRVKTTEEKTGQALENSATAVSKSEAAVSEAGSAVTVANQAKATAGTASSDAATAKANAATALSQANAAADASSAAIERVESVEAELSDKASTGYVDSVKATVDEQGDLINANTERLSGVYAKVTPLTADSTSLTADSSSTEAGSWSLQSAAAEGDLALSKRIDITQAQIDENKATIASESTARVNADSALGQRIDTVQVQFLSNLATVQSEVKTVSDAQGATAGKVDTIQSTVDGHTASIRTQQDAIDGISTQYTVKLDTGGYVAGFGLMNSGKSSNFIIRADMFAIAPPAANGNAAKYAFVYQASPVTLPNGTVIPAGLKLDDAVIGTVNADKLWVEKLSSISSDLGALKAKSANIEDGAIQTAHIGNAQVDTLKIKDNAVTVPVSAFAEISVAVNTEYVTIQTLAVPSDMGHTTLTFGAVFSFTGYSPKQQVLCRVLKNDQVVFEDLEVHFIEHSSVALITDANGSHNHNGSTVNVSGNTGQDGSHSHSFNASGTTGSTNAGGDYHSHSFNANGSTNSNGSHSHSVNLSGNVVMSEGGAHTHNITVQGNSRSAGTLNISRHDSTGIAGTFKLQLKAVSGGSMNVSQRYIHAMTMRK